MDIGLVFFPVFSLSLKMRGSRLCLPVPLWNSNYRTMRLK